MKGKPCITSLSLVILITCAHAAFGATAPDNNCKSNKHHGNLKQLGKEAAPSPCCCSEPAITINNSIGIASAPLLASGATLAGAADYKSLVDHLDDTAGKAITTAQNSVDWMGKIFTAFGAFLAATGLILTTFGIRSWSDFKTGIRKKNEETLEKIKRDADLAIEDHVRETRKSLDSIVSGGFLAHFISAAHGHQYLAEQLDVALKDDSRKSEHALLRAERTRNINSANYCLNEALTHLKEADNRVVQILVTTVARSPIAVEKDGKVVLQAWIELSRAWLAKKQGNIREAVLFAKKAYELKSEDETIVYNLACYCSLERDLNNSLFFLKKAIERNPKLGAISWKEEDFDRLREERLSDYSKIVGPPPPSQPTSR